MSEATNALDPGFVAAACIGTTPLVITPQPPASCAMDKAMAKAASFACLARPACVSQRRVSPRRGPA